MGLSDSAEGKRMIMSSAVSQRKFEELRSIAIWGSVVDESEIRSLILRYSRAEDKNEKKQLLKELKKITNLNKIEIKSVIE